MKSWMKCAGNVEIMTDDHLQLYKEGTSTRKAGGGLIVQETQLRQTKMRTRGQ